MPCGKRTRTFNHSGQLEKFITLRNCNATLHQLLKHQLRSPTHFRDLPTAPGSEISGEAQWNQ